MVAQKMNERAINEEIKSERERIKEQTASAFDEFKKLNKEQLDRINETAEKEREQHREAERESKEELLKNMQQREDSSKGVFKRVGQGMDNLVDKVGKFKFINSLTNSK